MKRHPLKHNVGNYILLKPVPMIKQIFCEIQHDLRHLVTGKKSVKLQLRLYWMLLLLAYITTLKSSGTSVRSFKTSARCSPPK